MKKKDRILREILYRVYEKDEHFMTQKSLAQSCQVSLDTANQVIKKLSQFHSVEKKPLAFKVINPQKILLYWASTRNLAADVVYTTYSPNPVEDIENQMPGGAIFTAYSGYRRKFSAPQMAYDEVHVYADPDEVKRKFAEKPVRAKNLVVLKQDPDMKRVSSGGVVSLGQLYVDLWQLGTPPAERLILGLDQRLRSRPVKTFATIVKKWRQKYGD